VIPARSASPVAPLQGLPWTVAVLLWTLAAALTHVFGIWGALGSAAVLLGAWVLALESRLALSSWRPDARAIALGAAAGAAMCAATYFAYPLARRVPYFVSDLSQLYSAFRSLERPYAALALGPVIVGEELVWRGAVQRQLVRRFGLGRGVALAAVSYAIAHLAVGSPVLVMAALCCGVAWGALAAARGIAAPIAAHLVWSFVVLFVEPIR
jgi:membrane protease YdiL (CAAX protease family)